jgi:hypothetical protein
MLLNDAVLIELLSFLYAWILVAPDLEHTP